MHIRYDFAQISGAVQDIRSSATRINAQLDELKSIIAPMAQTWEGEASDSYQAHQLKWDNAAADLNAILNQIATTVEQGNTTMSDVNRAAANSWG